MVLIDYMWKKFGVYTKQFKFILQYSNDKPKKFEVGNTSCQESFTWLSEVTNRYNMKFSGIYRTLYIPPGNSVFHSR